MRQPKPIHLAIKAAINDPHPMPDDLWIAFLSMPLATRFVDCIVRGDAADYRAMRRAIRRPNRRAIHGDYAIAAWPTPAPAVSQETAAPAQTAQILQFPDQPRTASHAK